MAKKPKRELFAATENKKRSIQIAFRVNEAEKEVLEKLAKQSQIGVSNLIRAALDDYVNRATKNW